MPNSTDPTHGRLDVWTRLLPPVPGAVPSEEHGVLKPGELPPGPWDPGLFQVEDGKTCLYWGSSNVHPLYAAQLDLKLGDEAEGEGKRLAFATRPQALFTLHPAEHGWERFGHATSLTHRAMAA